MLGFLRFWRRRWECAGLYDGLETLAAVRAVAEGLVFRKAATAKRNSRSSREVEALSLSILNNEVTRNPKRSVREYDDFHISH